MAELVRISADDNDLEGRAPFTRICGAWLVGGSDAATADVYDAATVTGTPKFTLKAAANLCSPYVYFPGGVYFKTKISVDLTGTGMLLFLLVE